MAKEIKEISHSSLGASGASRWIACPGSVALCKDIPNVGSSFYAAEGTVAHEVGELCLRKGLDAKDYLGEIFTTEVENKPTEFEVNDDMAQAVQVYVDFVRKTQNELKNSELKVETKFNLNHLYKKKDKDDLSERGQKLPSLYGTNDACVIQPFGKLVVIDYKHGVGVGVSAEKNKQLMYYCLGAGHELDYAFTEVEMVIVQPRSYRKDDIIRKFSMSAKDLIAWGEELKNSALKTTHKNAGFSSGDHCRWCPAAKTVDMNGNAVCKERKKEIDNKIMAAFEDKDSVVHVSDPTNLNIKQLVEAGKIAEIILGNATKWAKSVNSHMLHLAEKGTEFDGLVLSRSRKGNRAWIDKDAVEEEFSEEFGEDIYAPKKVKTPAQLEKIVGEDNIKGMTSQSDGKLILVKDKKGIKVEKAPLSINNMFGDKK